MKNSEKYRPFPRLLLTDRRWPDNAITEAPRWCSVDLRDGNQALPNPMTVEQKLKMFKMLVACGFKEIEIGFPAASEADFAFTRELIEKGHIPDDVTVQVLVQAREDLIMTTCVSLIGAKKAIIHLYNSTSPVQRRIVFGLEKPDIVKLAVKGVEWIKENTGPLTRMGTEVTLQYSPESFSATEIEFSIEICEAVMEAWQPTPERKIIINLPATVECAMPNVYADQIEWFLRNVKYRQNLVLCVHTHNDRGSGVAATEMALLAGAERVEGTLFGNGERTGNLDIITAALNMHTQGVDPLLDFSDVGSLREVYEECTGMTVDHRHPYSGDLVFTAFSGSHQDAIRKGLAAQKLAGEGATWDVPYLAINPQDIGRSYERLVRINSQSGKGGVAFVLEHDHGIILPKGMQREFGAVASRYVDDMGAEVSSEEIKCLFYHEYTSLHEIFSVESLLFGERDKEGNVVCTAVVNFMGETHGINGCGNGPVAAFVDAINEGSFFSCDVAEYHEHSMGSGADALAISYVSLRMGIVKTRWGVGIDANIEIAAIKAVSSAINRMNVKKSRDV